MFNGCFDLIKGRSNEDTRRQDMNLRQLTLYYTVRHVYCSSNETEISIYEKFNGKSGQIRMGN